LQRIGKTSHSSGMRSTFWQCGHLAWTTCDMATPSRDTRALCQSYDDILRHKVPGWKLESRQFGHEPDA
jgi:hypothetical protein